MNYLRKSLQEASEFHAILFIDHGIYPDAKKQAPSLSLEIKQIIGNLEQLSTEERKTSLMVTSEVFSWKIKEEIDCMGCSTRLQEYLQDLFNISKKRGEGINFDGFVISSDSSIGK